MISLLLPYSIKSRKSTQTTRTIYYYFNLETKPIKKGSALGDAFL